MNDFDFDVMQKKRIANNAARMKRGSKSKKCSLPSDHLTQAQWKRRNGPVNTYSLNQPMDWETFKSLPIDIQQSYVDILQRRFNVTAATISKELFGKSNPVLRLHMDKHGIKYTSMKGRGMTADEREIWEHWLNPVAPECAKPEEGEPEAVTDVPEEVPEVDEIAKTFIQGFDSVPVAIPRDDCDEPKFDIDELTAVFSGEFDPDRFLRFVTSLPMPDGNIRIKVEVTRK
jgi:hypothetical protein